MAREVFYIPRWDGAVDYVEVLVVDGVRHETLHLAPNVHVMLRIRRIARAHDERPSSA